MADHLDYIRIHGLESSSEEVLQGLGGASLTVTGSGTCVTTTTEEVVDYGNLFEMIWAWLTGQQPQSDPDVPRSLNRGLPEISGNLLPDILRKGLSLPPAVIQKVVETAIIDITEETIDREWDRLDYNSPRNNLKRIREILNDIDDHLKTALIWEDGILGFDKSILGTALLDENNESRIRIDELLVAIQDLKYNDEEIVIGDLHAYLRNKIVEY
jgi:hypothetical protein